MRELRLVGGRRLAPRAVLQHAHGVRRGGLVGGALRIDDVGDLRHGPARPLVELGVLDELPALPLEPRLPERRAQAVEQVVTAGRPRGGERRLLRRGAVAVPALDLDGVGHLRIDVAVAVHVLLAVAVDAVHPLLEVDVAQVDGLGEPLRVGVRDRVVVRVEQHAVPVLLEDLAEVPAVAVLIRELDRLELGVVLRERVLLAEHLQALVVGHLGDVRVGVGRPPAGLADGRGVGLVVPPERALVGADRAVALVVVAGDALRDRHLGRELVDDGEPARAVRQDVRARARDALVAVLQEVVEALEEEGDQPGVVDLDGSAVEGGRLETGRSGEPIAVVRVERVAGGAAAVPVVARLLVRPDEPERGVVQPGLEHVQVDDRDLRVGAREALAGDEVAGLEDAEDVLRHRRLGLGMGLHARQRAALGRLRAEAVVGEERRLAMLGERLAVDRDFPLDRAVVVEDGVVDHGVVRHDRLAHAAHDLGVTVPARVVRDAQVARVHEADELGRLAVDGGIARLAVGALGEELRVLRLHVSVGLVRAVAVAAVAFDAGERAGFLLAGLDVLDVDLGVHLLDAGVALLARRGARPGGVGGRREQERRRRERDGRTEPR